VVRQAATAALEGMGAGAVMGLIDVMKNGKDAFVSRAAADMLQKIGSQTGIDAANAWLNSRATQTTRIGQTKHF